MNPVMYLIFPTPEALPMSKGKMAAQAGHAAVEAYRLSCKGEGGNFQESSIANRWRRGGHYAKVALQTNDLAHACHYIEGRGFKVARIFDEGRTEFDADLTFTAIGVEIVDKDRAHVRETFGLFKLFTDNDRRVPKDVEEKLRKQLAERKKPSRWSKFKKGVDDFLNPAW